LYRIVAVGRGFAGFFRGLSPSPAIGENLKMAVMFESFYVRLADGSKLRKLPALRPTMSTSLLLVDDDTMARRTLAAMLARFGFRVVQASDAEEALATLKMLTPDVILSDYNMPGMNGAALLREIRCKLPQLSGVPFILCSGYIDAWTGGRNDPAPDMLLSKPVTIDRLLAEISELMRRYKPSQIRVTSATPAA
jgi:CheY-like chemotaxis protein